MLSFSGKGQYSNDLLKSILKIDDRNLVELRKYVEVYFHPFLNFLLKNLDETPCELLSVSVTDFTPVNGAILQPVALQNLKITEKQSSVIETTLAHATEAPLRRPTVWYKLLTEMVLVLSDFSHSSIRGPEIHFIKSHFVTVGIMRRDADAEEAAQLILRVFGWITMFFEPPSRYTKNIFRPSKNESKSAHPAL